MTWSLFHKHSQSTLEKSTQTSIMSLSFPQNKEKVDVKRGGIGSEIIPAEDVLLSRSEVYNSISIDETMNCCKRVARNVRKPMTYQEPSLRIKVRKGFEFFKFENSEVDNTFHKLRN